MFDIPKNVGLYEQYVNGAHVNFKKCATLFDTDCDQALTNTMIQTLSMSNQPIPKWLWLFQLAIQQNKDYDFNEINDSKLLMTNMYRGSYFDKEDELDLPK